MKKIESIIKATTTTNLKGTWYQSTLKAFIALFIFTSINREFLPLGLDLRFIQLPLGAVLLFINILSKKYRPDHKKNDPVGKALIIFYIYAFISNIAWAWNGLQPQYREFINELILLSNVLIGILVLYFNNNRIEHSFLVKSILFSCLILTLSIFLVHQGLTLQQILGSPDVAYIYRSAPGVHHINIFGEQFRCAGYASDPNYATILLLIGIICAIRLKKHHTLKLILIILFGLAIGLSFSKTIIFSLLPCLIYTQVIKSPKIKTINKIRLNRIIIIGVFIVVLALPHLRTLLKGTIPFTLDLRLKMWQSANNTFIKNPITGSGITSFRSGFIPTGWYVHAHSTYWQIISELGVIGLILYYTIILKILNNSLKRPSQYFLILVFMIWAFTYESIALPMSIIIYYVMTLNQPEQRRAKKHAVLFFVNSLKQGGAEKACVNLANEFKKQHHDVDFIVLKYQKGDIKSPNRFCIYNLNTSAPNKFLRIIKNLFAIPKINDFITSRQIDFGDYNIITTHLPASNIITRLSIINKQAIYVIHCSMDIYKFYPHIIYSSLVKMFFRNRKVASVSKGLTQELTKRYGLQPNYTQTIYNPIDSVTVKKTSSKKRPFKAKYLLYAGRFTKEKRPDRMLEIFHNGKFYKNYQLVFCGEGEMLQQVKDRAIALKINDSVHFVGYQNNIYTWMKHSSVLINTSDWESFSMVAAEALASGAKVVSSDCPYGPNEILINQYAKFLVSPINDVSQYIQKINNALKSYPKNPAPILAKFNPQNIAQRYIEYYSE